MEFALRRLKAIANIRAHGPKGHMTAEEVTNLLREFPDLLTLEHDNELGEVAKNATAAIKNTLALDDMKSELCSGKSRNEKTSLFFPICLDIEMVNSLRMGADLLAGPKEIVLGQDDSGQDVKILIDLTKVLKTPIADIKALLPVSFDNDGNPVDYPDQTMGGLFPNGDLIAKFKKLGGDDIVKTNQAMKDLTKTILKVKDRI
jgi:hypothetical protein